MEPEPSKQKPLQILVWSLLALAGISLLFLSYYAVAKSSTWHITYRLEGAEIKTAGAFLNWEVRRWVQYLVGGVLAIGLMIWGHRIFPAVVSELKQVLANAAPMSSLGPGPRSRPANFTFPWVVFTCVAGLLAILLTVMTLRSRATDLPQANSSPSRTPKALPANNVALSLTPDGPSKISANEQVPIGVTISLEGQHYDDQPLLLERNQQYLVSTRLQPGAFDVAAEYLKPREEVISAGVPVTWNWIIAPKLDRLGAQKIAFDAEIYDQNKQKRIGKRSLIATIDVENAIGLPNWMVYVGPLVGFMAMIPFGSFVFTEFSNRLKERREAKRKAEEAMSAGKQKKQKFGKFRKRGK